MQLEVEGLGGRRDARRRDRIGRQGQDVPHLVPAPRLVRVEEQRRLVVADVGRERFEVVDLGAEATASAAVDVSVNVPGRDWSAGEQSDEQGSNRGEGETRTEMSHVFLPWIPRRARS